MEKNPLTSISVSTCMFIQGVNLLYSIMMLIDSERNVSRGKLLQFDTVLFILKV
jgi:hypothetical protein